MEWPFERSQEVLTRKRKGLFDRFDLFCQSTAIEQQILYGYQFNIDHWLTNTNRYQSTNLIDWYKLISRLHFRSSISIDWIPRDNITFMQFVEVSEVWASELANFAEVLTNNSSRSNKYLHVAKTEHILASKRSKSCHFSDKIKKEPNSLAKI